MQYEYPFRKFIKDLILWSAGAEVPAQNQGPIVVPQLQGEARNLANAISLDVLIHGENADWNDGQGLCHHAGLHVLIRRLAERFGELEIETVIRTLIEFFSFSRKPGEDIDTAITRFDILFTNANDHAHMSVSPTILAFIMLRAFHVAPSRWPALFMPWGGNFPINDDQVRALKTGLRQQGHMLENHPSGLGTQFTGMGSRSLFHTDTSYDATDDTYAYHMDSGNPQNQTHSFTDGIPFAGGCPIFEGAAMDPGTGAGVYWNPGGPGSGTSADAQWDQFGTCVTCGSGDTYEETYAGFDTDTESENRNR